MPAKKPNLVYSERAAVGILGDAFHQKHFMWSVSGSDAESLAVEHEPSGTKLQFQKILPTSRVRSSEFLLTSFDSFLVLAEESTLEAAMKELGDIRKSNRAPVMVVMFSKAGSHEEAAGEGLGQRNPRNSASPQNQQNQRNPQNQQKAQDKQPRQSNKARRDQKTRLREAKEAPMSSLTTLSALRDKAETGELTLLETEGLDSSGLLPNILSFAAEAARRPDEGEYDVADEEPEKRRCVVM